VLAAQESAKNRAGNPHPEWYHGEGGTIKVIGEFDLGKKGGKWQDATPMMVTRPG